MRKALTLFLTAVILLLSLYSAVFAVTNKEKDNVIITEEFVYGDRSFAENVDINLKMQYRENLLWDINYSVVDGKTETDFSLHKNRIERDFDSKNDLILYSMLDYTTFGAKPTDTSLNKAYNELIEEAVPFEETSKTIRLIDYIEYYPVTVDASFSIGGSFSLDSSRINDVNDIRSEGDLKFISDLQDFFKIPVHESHEIEISVLVDEEKNVHQFGSSSSYNGERELDSFSFNSSSVTTDSECFIYFSNRSRLGNPVDTSEIPGGYGIYLLTYSPSENGDSLIFDTDGLKNIFPVKAQEEIQELKLSKDEKELYMISQNGSITYLTVIDAEAYEEKSKIIVSDFEGQTSNFGYIDEEFIVINHHHENYDSTFSLYLPDVKEVFKEYFRTLTHLSEERKKKPDSDEYFYPGAAVFINPEIDVKWDGENLYVTNSDTDRHPTRKDNFSLSIYNRDGLQFSGLYTTSLSTGNDSYQDSSYYIYQSYYDPIKIILN